VLVSTLELVSILKRVPSSSKIVRSNTASSVKVVSDSSGCSVKIENKCGKNRKARRHSNKKVSALLPCPNAHRGFTLNAFGQGFTLSERVRPKASSESSASDVCGPCYLYAPSLTGTTPLASKSNPT